MRKVKILFPMLALLLAVGAATGAEYAPTIKYTVLNSYVMPGGETVILFTLANPSGSPTLSNMKAYFTAGDYLAVSPGSIDIGGLNTGASQDTAVRVSAGSIARTATSFVRVKVTYMYENSPKESSMDVPVSIRRDPVVQVESSRTNDSASPGRTVALALALKNNGDGSARDVTVSIGQNENVFVPEPSEAFVREMQPGESTTLQFLLTISPSAGVGTYSLPIALNYYNEIRTVNFSATKYADLKVVGDYDLIATVDSQDALYAGGSGYATLKIANAGTYEARFLVLKYNGQTFYTGNLKSDDYDTQRLLVSVPSSASGSYPITIGLGYRDPFGNRYAENRTVEVKVTGPGKTKKEDGSASYWLVAVAAVAVGYYFYSRGRKAGRSK